MAYVFKNFEYHQLGGSKEKYYGCYIFLDLPEDLIRDIKDYLSSADITKADYISLKEKIEKNALDDLRHILNQNNIKFSISRYNPMNLNIYMQDGQLELIISWETPISDENKLALDKLDALIN